MGVRIAQAQNTGSSGRSPKTLSGSASRSRARLHLGQAGPEGQVLSKWLKSATLPGRSALPVPGPGALGPESRFQRHKTPHT